MAYGSRFCDLFDGVALLLLHSEAKKLGLPCLLVPYKPLANYIFWQQIDIFSLFSSLDTR